MSDTLKHYVDLEHGFTPGPIKMDDAIAAQMQLHGQRTTNLVWHHVACDSRNWAPDVTVFGVRGQYLPTINQIHMFEYHAANRVFQPVLDLINSPWSVYHELRHAYNASCFFHEKGPWNYRTFALDEVTARVAEYLAHATRMPVIHRHQVNIDVDYNLGGLAKHIVTAAVHCALKDLEDDTHYQSYWKRYEMMQGERLTTPQMELPDETVWMQMRLFFINDMPVDIYQYLRKDVYMHMEQFLDLQNSAMLHRINRDKQRG